MTTLNTTPAMTHFSTAVLTRIEENWSWNPEQLTRCLRTLWKNTPTQDDKSLDLVKSLIATLTKDLEMHCVKFRHTPYVVEMFHTVHSNIYIEGGKTIFEREVLETLEVKVEPKLDLVPVEIDVYTDGSQSSKTLCGGWGVILSSNKGHTKELSGAKMGTTHNEMELEAMIQAINTIKYKEGMTVRIHTDSLYVLNALASLEKYKEKGFAKAKNQDYLQELLDAMGEKDLVIESLVPRIINNKEISPGDTLLKAGGIEFIWVKGHSVSEGNNKVDALCVGARKQAEKLL